MDSPEAQIGLHAQAKVVASQYASQESKTHLRPASTSTPLSADKRNQQLIDFSTAYPQQIRVSARSNWGG
jgi:hypothetical protein